MIDTPQAVRRHIAIFGRRNVGKSSLLNALTGQQAAIVSSQAGTTTDPVRRAMEIHGLGPCLFIDTAGFDDQGDVGILRNDRTKRVIDETDLALLVMEPGTDLTMESRWLSLLRNRDLPVVAVLNKDDLYRDDDSESLPQRLGMPIVTVSALTGKGIDHLRQAMVKAVGHSEEASLTASLVHEGDTVLLVMPQDRQAPAGRLILPQVQTIRDLLDNECIVMCVTLKGLPAALKALQVPPALIITDSQVFKQVHALTPPETRLTSFSVLMSALKGNVDVLARGARTIAHLTTSSRVLIAEACTHAPMSEDIGRVQLPRLIRERVGRNVQFDVVSGKDFPHDLTSYDLVIHCGGCMINSSLMRSRIARATRQGVPITNYGLAIAQLQGILPHITLPLPAGQ